MIGSKEMAMDINQKAEQEKFEGYATYFEKKANQETANEIASKNVANNETAIKLSPNRLSSLNKAELTCLAQDYTSEYLDGFKSPAEGLFYVKKLKEFAEQAEKNLADAAANELKLVKGEKRAFMNAVVNEQMVGVRYDYASTGDKEWIDLNAKLKEREKFLQGIKGSITLVDKDSGEVYNVFEPTKSGKMGLIFKY